MAVGWRSELRETCVCRLQGECSRAARAFPLHRNVLAYLSLSLSRSLARSLSRSRHFSLVLVLALALPQHRHTNKQETKLSHHTGIYFGWAQRSGGSDPSRLYKSAVSIGWNPYYKNKKKTIEPHLIHDFKGEKFYGETLKLMICGFLRPEKNFNGLDELVAAIKQDIENSSTRLDEKEYQELRKSKFWGWKEGNSAVPSTADTAKEGAAAAASKEA